MAVWSLSMEERGGHVLTLTNTGWLLSTTMTLGWLRMPPLNSTGMATWLHGMAIPIRTRVAMSQPLFHLGWSYYHHINFLKNNHNKLILIFIKVKHMGSFAKEFYDWFFFLIKTLINNSTCKSYKIFTKYSKLRSPLYHITTKK